MSDLDACDPGTVTPLWVPVDYMPQPGAPGGVIAWPPTHAWTGWDDGLAWPPHTPGTHAPGDGPEDW